MNLGLFARAKVNLTLHVTGRRSDGYRMLDSLVVFPELGDILSIAPARDLTLSTDGPFSGALCDDPDNLVLRAARLLSRSQGAAMHLTKNLPVASGIGGGSADAAAALVGLSRMWGVAVDEGMATQIGADVPVCLASTTSRMQGIGEVVSAVDGVPEFWIVLANRGVAVPTGPVFSALERDDLAGMPDVIPAFRSAPEMCDWLSEQRNDLQAAALRVEPGIAEVLDALSDQSGCLMARMSGSGGTSFAIFESGAAASTCAAGLQSAHPDWWVQAARVRPGSGDPRHDKFG